MMEKLKGNNKAFNVICAVLLAVLLALQFTPFWHFTADEEQLSSSISTYIWFPEDSDDLDDYLSDAIEDHSINNMLGTPILLLVVCAVGIVLCLVKSSSTLTMLLPLLGGVTGVIGYLTTPALQLGSNWMLHLIVSIVLLVVAAAGLALNFKGSRAS